MTEHVRYTFVPTTEHGESLGGPAGSPGEYRVVLVLGIPGSEAVTSQLDLAALQKSGDSLIASPSLKIDIQPPDEQSAAWLVHANSEGRLARAEVSLQADGMHQAEENAHDLVMQMLSRLAFAANVGIEPRAILVTEVATGTQSVAAHVVGKIWSLPDISGTMDESLLPLLAAYREGVSSTVPSYQALCFYKVIEDIETFHKTRVRAVEKIGGSPPTDSLAFTFPGPEDTVAEIDSLEPEARVTFVRGEHSEEGKSDLSTKRSVPMADRLFRELDGWSKRTELRAEEDLVFAHPQTGNALDRSKVTKRFKEACVDAKVPTIRFHDLRHTFGTRLAASGQPMRMIQEFLGHADSKTTQIYTHYAPSEHEVKVVNEAFAPKAEAKPPESEQVPAADDEGHVEG